jgi:tol-pal system protein YbgF
MRKWFILGLIIPLVACTSGEDISLLHREITDVQREVQQLKVSTLDKGDLAAMEKGVQEATQKTLRSNADLLFKVTELQEKIEALHASLDVTTRHLQTISQELVAVRAEFQSRPVYRAAPPATEPATSDSSSAPVPAGTGQTSLEQPPTTPVAAPVTSPPSPEALYRSAYEDYMRSNYDLAAQGFQEYLRRWGTTDLADNAQYWIGECYDAQGLSQEALAAFSEVLEKYPTSDKAAAAQLKKGLLYLKLGDQGQGVVNLQYVVFEHPGTREADLAREKLRSLGLTIR